MKKYAGVLQRVREIEEKKGICYAKPGDMLYKVIKIVYTVAAAWALIMNLMFLLSTWINLSEADMMDKVSNLVITVAVCSGLIVLGYILNCFKAYIISAVLSIASSVMLILTFAKELEDATVSSGYNSVFYWRHLIPLVIMIIAITWLTIIAVRAKVKTEKQYKKVMTSLYDTFKQRADASEITDGEWEEFLKNYNPDDI